MDEPHSQPAEDRRSFVEEVACIAQGDAACIIQVDRQPVD